MTQIINDQTVPRLNPTELKAYQGNVKEIVDALTRIEAENDLIKTIAETAHEKYGVDKALTKKTAKIMYKRNLDEERAKAEDLFDWVDTVINGGIKGGDE